MKSEKEIDMLSKDIKRRLNEKFCCLFCGNSLINNCYKLQGINFNAYMCNTCGYFSIIRQDGYTMTLTDEQIEEATDKQDISTIYYAVEHRKNFAN